MALNLFVGSGGDNVHGEFGDAQEWNRPPSQPPAGYPGGLTIGQLVDAWLQQNPGETADVCDVLLRYTALNLQARRQALIDYVSNQLIGEVTLVSGDPRYPQRSLSERLANAGILPMFGFPTRTRYLYHERPRSAREWPPEDVIDRDLDIAVSQFAPGSETVKDGLVHTAAGVVDYVPQGNTVTEEQNPLGPPIPVGLCARCQAVDGSLPPAPSCPVCGATTAQNPGYRIIDIAQPTGFCTWFQRGPRDFDGAFEWTPRASRPKMGVVPLPMNNARNFVVGADQQSIYIVNDNDGRLFSFERVNQGETWVTRGALDKIGVANPPIAPGTATDRALGSIKPTDVLVLGVQNWPVGTVSSPTALGTRAALFSFGFLLRRAAADRLDIHERELRVGLRVLPDPFSQIAGQVFISDSLENGAGYSSLLGTTAEMEELLRFVLGQNDPSFYDVLVGPPHRMQCRTSCPDCLRDFTNLTLLVMPAGMGDHLRLELHAIPATSPSTYERMRMCFLQAAFARAPETHEFILGNPLAWLGAAYHEVLARLHHREAQGSTLDDKIVQLWNAAVTKQYDKTRAHPLDRRFGSPETWPRYFAAAAITTIRAREVARRPATRQQATKAPGTSSSNLVEQHLVAFEGKLVGRPDAVRNGEVIDYKTGELLDGDDPTALKESYVRQLRLYAVLAHQSLGWWPHHGVLAPMTGASVHIELSPTECLGEATKAVALLDHYNDLIKQGTDALALASPSPTACNSCAFQILCQAFWRHPGPASGPTHNSRVVEGIVPSSPTPIQEGAAYTLTLDIGAGTEPPRQTSLAPLSPLIHERITRISPNDQVRAVGLRPLPDGSLSPTIRTVVARVAELPHVTAAVHA